jgi:lactate dehydrogenase-like 2-hydroxyacid dehydrogenase
MMKEEKMHSDITQRLVERARAKGINTDEVVYSICIGDIIECIADVYEEEAFSFSDDKLNEFIEKGIKATEWISWSDTIEKNIYDVL